MKKNSSIKSAIHRAVILGITVSSAATVQVFAEEGVDAVERIAVTGSRINRTDIETASPVTVISSDFIIKSGYNSVQ